MENSVKKPSYRSVCPVCMSIVKLKRKKKKHIKSMHWQRVGRKDTVPDSNNHLCTDYGGLPSLFLQLLYNSFLKSCPAHSSFLMPPSFPTCPEPLLKKEAVSSLKSRRFPVPRWGVHLVPPRPLAPGACRLPSRPVELCAGSRVSSGSRPAARSPPAWPPR